MHHLAPLQIQQGLPQGQIFHFEQLNSTNEYLLTHYNDIPQGSICIADKQTAGRGRRGRQWFAPKGNLYYSFYWKFPIEKNLYLPPISLLIGLSVIEILEEFGVKDLNIKWPNDLYYREKKAGGILAEVKTTADHIHLVIGIGINLSYTLNSQNIITQPFSDLSDYNIDRNLFIIKITQKLQKICAEYPTLNLADTFSKWQKYDLFYQKDVCLLTDKINYQGIAEGINEKGELILNQRGKKLAFAIGEISLRENKR